MIENPYHSGKYYYPGLSEEEELEYIDAQMEKDEELRHEEKFF